MEIQDIRANPMWATKDELGKQKMLEKAYKKMQSGTPMSKEEDEVLSEYTKLMSDINKTKTSVDAHKSLLGDGNKYASVLMGLSMETEKMANDRMNAIYNANAPVQVVENKPNYQSAMMASLMKDTPEGVFQNAQARILAENDAVQRNYRIAYQGLRNESDRTFKELLGKDPELSHPDVVDDAHNYFKILKDYSPAMAKNPTVLKSFIMKARTYGGIDPKELTGLIQTNNEYMRHAANVNNPLS